MFTLSCNHVIFAWLFGVQYPVTVSAYFPRWLRVSASIRNNTIPGLVFITTFASIQDKKHVNSKKGTSNE
jgi:hypothetical protein